jgi:hypothetical protein
VTTIPDASRVIVLSPMDLLWGWHLGQQRAIRSTYDNRKPRAAGHIEGSAKHLYGALAECAAARHLGLDLPATVDTFHDAPDLAPDWEIRWRSRDDYQLIIRPDSDNMRRRFVHVTGEPPTFVIHGYISGLDAATHPEWLRNHGGYGDALFVPAEALRPVGRAT